jgi:hypothetical protein
MHVDRVTVVGLAISVATFIDTLTVWVPEEVTSEIAPVQVLPSASPAENTVTGITVLLVEAV